ncbi:KDO2-lipid IV(A) lauroyltransferase [Fibrobacter succinogenes subsp. elongatus]|uniref:KDO2-lipid IV(A) lauroyltransferase n=1 Tax=Fibrobacter succinogenes TaxID=833 RepID=A0A380RXV8_FIBSU|nr:KDO2-lipid IV(A) lauroyltransferase [Fibrobacter succinogenes subsp. elongatus]SUQ19797.1 KDO2-lipid IV(A) lauroyltransferase [Fibrobacter succinogenes]
MTLVRKTLYKIFLHTLLCLPNIFYSAFFTVVFPIYKVLHKKRAYGRVEKHLAAAKEYVIQKSDGTNKMPRNVKSPNPDALAAINARNTFKGIFWNALESYRGLARFKSIEKRIVYENEHIIRDAIADCAKTNAPIAGISIHQGAFELMHRALCRYSEHVHLITDSVGDIAFREVLKDLRSDPHLTEYHPDETGRLIRELFRTKGILAMVIDQGKHTKGNTVSLFGRPSTLYLRLPKKINEMGAGIVTFRTWSEKKRIVIRFEKYYPPKYDAGIGNAENAAPSESPLVTGIAREVETWIVEHPEQWSWNYHGNFIG